MKCGASYVEFGPNDHGEDAPHFRFHYDLYIDLSLSTFFRFALIFVDDGYSSLLLLNIVVTLFRFTARHFFYFRDYSVLNTFKIKLFENENLNNQDRQIKTH